MEQMRNKLPPLKSLIALESVVRLKSVTKAAEELCVTHSAISKQINTLEDWVGQPLFLKNRKIMHPTHEAVLLARAAAQAFSVITQAVEDLEPTRDALTLLVIAPSTFAMRWLIPKVWHFSEEHKHIDVQVRQTHKMESWRDIDFDVAIRPDPERLEGFSATPFLSERLTMAISPRSPYFDSLSSPEDLSRSGILCSVSRDGELQAWLTEAGFPDIDCDLTSFAHFYLALEAALAGMGPLVCPREVLGDLLTKGELVEPWPHILVKGPVFTAIYDPGSAKAKAVRLFVTWLKALGRTSTLCPVEGIGAQNSAQLHLVSH